MTHFKSEKKEAKPSFRALKSKLNPRIVNLLVTEWLNLWDFSLTSFIGGLLELLFTISRLFSKDSGHGVNTNHYELSFIRPIIGKLPNCSFTPTWITDLVQVFRSIGQENWLGIGLRVRNRASKSVYEEGRERGKETKCQNFEVSLTFLLMHDTNWPSERAFASLAFTNGFIDVWGSCSITKEDISCLY